jgi:hypothetical protein
MQALSQLSYGPLTWRAVQITERGKTLNTVQG